MDGTLHDPALRLDLLQDHVRHPRHYGAIEDADVVMPGGHPGCGDVVTIHLRAKEGRIADVRWEGHGCTVSQATASLLLEEIHARGLLADPQAILALDYRHIEELIGEDLVRARPRCATLALGTLKSAVRAWLSRAPGGG